MSAVLPAHDEETAAGERPGGVAADAEWFIVLNRGSGSAEKDEVRRTIEAELMAVSRRQFQTGVERWARPLALDPADAPASRR